MRFRHFFTRHEFQIVSAVFNRPTGSYFLTPYSEEQKAVIWGFTEVLLRCECGKRKVVRLIGDHAGLKSEVELRELERLASA